MQLHPGFVPSPSMLVPICTYHSLQSIERLRDSDFLYKLAVHTLYSREKVAKTLPTRIYPVTIPSLSPHALYLNCLASHPSPSFRSSASSTTVTFRPRCCPLPPRPSPATPRHRLPSEKPPPAISFTFQRLS